MFVFHVLLETVQLYVQVVQVLGVEGPHAVLLILIFFCMTDLLMVFLSCVLWPVLKDMVVMVLSCDGVGVLVLVVHGVCMLVRVAQSVSVLVRLVHGVC